MRTSCLVLLAALCFGQQAAGQMLDEGFETSVTGAFPPAGWSQTNSGTSAIWQDASGIGLLTLSADAAGHDYHFTSTADCDDLLWAPSFSLATSGAPQLTFDSDVRWTLWMAHHPASNSNGESHAQVSVDGGLTWTDVWSEDAIVDGFYPQRTVDLTAVAAYQATVELRFHYFGNNAHLWAIDNVLVDDLGTAGPHLSIQGTCPGSVTLQATQMTPSGPVIFAYSRNPGSATLPSGPCAGLALPVAFPVHLATVVADGTGAASFSGNAPPQVCGGVEIIAVDGLSCVSTSPESL